MPALAANLYTMFGELPLLDRVAAAAEAGFAGVEAFTLHDVTAAQLQDRLNGNGVELVQLYAAMGDFEAGERGTAILGGRTAEFKTSVDRAIDDAQTLACLRINCLAGILPEGTDETTAQAVLLRNLDWAAERARAAGLTILIEPISNQGPRYFVRHTAHARALIAAIGAPNLKLLYDVYHAQVLEGNLAATLAGNIDVIDHVQVADVPGRHEPGTGEINYPFLLQFLDDLGYGGWVGCEYRPCTSTAAGLAWAAPYL